MEKKNKVVLSQEDFNQLKPYFSGSDDYDEMSIGYELSRATVVKSEELPKDVVSLNARVTIEDLGTKKQNTFTLVMPDHANIKEKKVSVLTPMGAAIIGFKVNDEVAWKMPAGMKRFRIVEVEQAP